MKKKNTNQSVVVDVVYFVKNVFNRLFFVNNHREFDRLKNFIAS